MANDVPVARLIGFQTKDIADGRATVILAAGTQHANPMGTLHGGIRVTHYSAELVYVLHTRPDFPAHPTM